MLCPRESNDEIQCRHIQALLVSSDTAKRLKGARLLYRRFLKALFVFAARTSRSSQTSSLKALRDSTNNVVDICAVVHVLTIMRDRLRSKARKGPFPPIHNLPGYTIGFFKHVAHDIWRQQLREDLRYRSGYNRWESIKDHRGADPLADAEFNESSERVREDIREFVRKQTPVNRIILTNQLQLMESPVEKRGRNKTLVELVNAALDENGFSSMSAANTTRRCNRLYRDLMQHLSERGWNV